MMMDNKKIINVFIMITMVLGMLVFVKIDSCAAESAGEVTFSVEKFTIGQGYLIEPTQVSISQGQSVADVTLSLLKQNGYAYESGNGKGFYLSGILKADNGVYRVPSVITSMGDMTDSGGSKLPPPGGQEQNLLYPDLCEYSYMSCSGWMYTVNGEFSGKAMDEYILKNGDIVRIQFSLYSYGGDLGERYLNNPYVDLPDRNPLTKRLALMRKYKEICDRKGYSSAYHAAYAAAVNMDISNESFYAAFNALPSEADIIAWVNKDEADKKAEAARIAALEKEAALKKKYTPARVFQKKPKSGKKKVKLSWKKILKASGYQIFMSTRKKTGYKKIVTIKKAKIVTYTKKKLKSKKTYYFRIRAYRKVGKKTYYGPYSKVKKVKIK